VRCQAVRNTQAIPSSLSRQGIDVLTHRDRYAKQIVASSEMSSGMQTDLAATHLIARDYEHAAAIARDAIRTATQLSSTTTLDRLRALQRQVNPLRKASPHLNELDQRITDLLTRKDS
jgi:hypothetical protein